MGQARRCFVGQVANLRGGCQPPREPIGNRLAGCLRPTCPTGSPEPCCRFNRMHDARPSPSGRTIIAHGVSRGMSGDLLRAPGRGRKKLPAGLRPFQGLVGTCPDDPRLTPWALCRLPGACRKQRRGASLGHKLPCRLRRHEAAGVRLRRRERLPHLKARSGEALLASIPALYRGTALAVPPSGGNLLGFSPCWTEEKLTGAKARNIARSSARLKPCPDTNPNRRPA